ncbi:aldehyde dehydrogenase family protein, partial [Halobacillus sp. BBL2006]|uniref:aldehyde dehydrogenase family protein n=1 Tax=Halobacillus sp. BBL2006 TaxID=1543706 RepID=UPI000543E4E7
MSQNLEKQDKLLNFINGEWVEPTTETYTNVMNPATKETLVQVPLSNSEDVESATESAKKAQKSWALVPAPQRAEVLYRVGLIMKDRKEHLAQLLTMENGKVIEEARGEVQEGIDMAFYMAGE